MDDTQLNARVEALKDRLREAKTLDAVNETVREITGDVMEIEAICKGSAAQIKNLAAYRRLCIGKGWG